VIIFMGVPGAGKTTILNSALEQKKEWRTINWGDRMVELAKASGLVEHRDEMRKLPRDKMTGLQEKTAESLAKEEGKWILDTHCSVNTPKGYLPGLPFNLLGKFKGVEKVVLVDAPVDHIMRRRKDDTSRVRDDEGRKSLEEHIFVNKSLACTYAAFTGANIVFIENADNKLDAAVEKLVGIM